MNLLFPIELSIQEKLNTLFSPNQKESICYHIPFDLDEKLHYIQTLVQLVKMHFQI